MNECEAASCDVMTVPGNTSTTKQLQSKSHFNEENVQPQMLPNPSRKRGRPKKTTENNNTESNLVNLSLSNCPNVCCVPNEACDTPNVVSDVIRLGMKRKEQNCFYPHLLQNTRKSMRWNYTWVSISQTTTNKNNFIEQR